MHDRSSSLRSMLKARSTLRRCRTLLTCGTERQGLIIEAAVALVRARLLLLAVPFQRLSTRWGDLVPMDDPRITSHAAVADSTADAETARAIGWAVTATATVMPFNAMCLQQAVAAREMLARRGIATMIHYGAGRDAAGRLVAHAWLDAAGAHVTGYPVAPNMAAIGAFVSQR